MERTILHCDCNGFYASVECVLHPELRSVPMADCGDPESRRGIILAKNELAKGYGIKTAETIWQAKRKCPQLVLAPAHHDQYALFSKRINGIYQRYTDLVEPFSIDESWLDVTGSRRLFGALCGGSVLVGTKMLACPAEIRLAQCEKGFAFGGYDTLSLKINHILVVFLKSFRHRPSWQKEAGP